MSYVVIEHLTFRFAGRQPAVINELSFTMSKGEIVGILGASGSGKSTLLRLIAGLEMPERGSITINEQIIVDNRIFIEPEKRGVGMVFQDYALFPNMTIADNIVFGLHKLKKSMRCARLEQMLELVQMKDYANRYPHELSGGQQQRIALARALAPEPSVLLMDEPFSSLDAHLKATIRSELRQILQKANITCLFVSHDQEDVKAICDRVIHVQGDS
ncbi:ABC transporter ATP-binding protein [Metasolibacillus meyeri]|uniref:Carnitine transport ATP-binding protein OpuCA n=1 Tax=Metasolibacillus meyeri TaxID=1071052 RepID=A0AAW9NVV5_9BACL|nr:ABC transporter ATP-binding protein [Metasolibacillus meyeri]MEC1178418.1 ABC transporter ATP-binding protein [Metasolibacillus meyeri]